MPCTYIMTPEEERQAREDGAKNTKSYKDLKKKLDEVTELLCSVLSTVDKEVDALYEEKDTRKHDLAVKISSTVFTYPPLSSEIREWWYKHKKADLAQKALKKLTKEEREALGL